MKRRYPIDPNRPTCVNIGCEKLVHLISYSSTGKPTYRPLCDACRKPKNCAREGVTGVKKDYCENRDGRLGHKCTATIMGYLQLDLDHIDGNHYNNVPENIQTLCKNCHSWKSHVNEDHLNFMRKEMPSSSAVEHLTVRRIKNETTRKTSTPRRRNQTHRSIYCHL